MTTKEPKIHVSFWGTRGSISTPGRGTEKYGGNTPCVSVRYQSTDIILDAGTGIRNLGISLSKQAREQNLDLKLHLLLSHTHWDHIQGLPFFIPSYMKGTSLSIYGSPQKETLLESILQGQMDINYFPVEMSALDAELKIVEITQQRFHVGELTIDWQEQVCHPGGSVRYRLMAANKKIVYATDVELDTIIGPNASGTAKNKRLAKQYAEFIRGADLLIADGQYTEKEYPFHRGWGHTSIPVLAEVAQREGVKQLAVFHHDPQHSDALLDSLWAQVGPKYGNMDPSLNIFWAREGMTIAI